MADSTRGKAVSLAVLPFRSMSDSVEHDHLSSGFVDDLIVDLSRYSGLEIIASYTANQLASGDVDLFEAADEIALSYLLKGSIRCSRESIRINTQLINVTSRKIIWAERYDNNLNDFFDVQDEIVERVVYGIQSEVEHDVLLLAQKKQPASLEAYDYWLRGTALLGEGTLEADRKGRELFNKALEVDPHYSRAYAGLSLSHFNEWSCQLWEIYEESQQFAHEYALKALQLDDVDHIIHMILGRVYLYRRQFEDAEYHITKSLSLNQSDADNLIQLASCFTLLGRVAEGERLVEKALSLNPYRNLWYYQYGSFVYFVKQDYELSIEMALKRQLSNIWLDLPGYIAAAHAYLGNSEEARKYLAMFIATFQASILKGKTPTSSEIFDWVRKANPFKYQSDTDNIINGLISAGLDDTNQKSSVIVSDRGSQSEISVSIFVKEQALWRIQFDGQEITLTNMKGLHDIQRLITDPEVDVHCTELMGGESSMDDQDLVIDDKARQAYKTHLFDLEEDIAEAQDHNDLARLQALQQEREKLLEHLSQSLGIGDRPRKFKSLSERSRAAVTLRIKNAIKKIAQYHPSLGKHLSNSVKTGVYCRYSPEEQREWQLH